AGVAMSARDNGPLDCKVYVGNLGSGATEYDLEKVFSYYGPLRSVWVARNPPGFAFVQFEDARDARDSCRELDGRLVCGSRVRVEMSTGERRQKRGWSAQPPWSRCEPGTLRDWGGGRTVTYNCTTFKSEYGWKRSPSPRRSPRRSVSPRRSPRRSPSPRRSLRQSPSPRRSLRKSPSPRRSPRRSPSPRRGSKRSSSPRRIPRRSPSPKRSRKLSSGSPKASGRRASKSRSRSVSPRPRKAAEAWRSRSPPTKVANSSSGS
uniref:RRM domain-containing protein n=1 Tax=Petromyzon marinus TaxID=7757 RepID=S4RMA8_PETMA